MGVRFQGLWLEAQGLIRCFALVSQNSTAWVSSLVALRDVKGFFGRFRFIGIPWLFTGGCFCSMLLMLFVVYGLFSLLFATIVI